MEKVIFVKMNNDFVLSPFVVVVVVCCCCCFFFALIAFANEKKGTSVEEKFAANEKERKQTRKSTGKQTNKFIKNPTNHNLTTTDGPSREREKGRERESEGNTNATTRRIVLISVSFPRFYFRAPAAVPRVSACSFELTTERKKERKKFCADLLIYDETSAFKLLVEG